MNDKYTILLNWPPVQLHPPPHQTKRGPVQLDILYQSELIYLISGVIWHLREECPRLLKVSVVDLSPDRSFSHVPGDHGNMIVHGCGVPWWPGLSASLSASPCSRSVSIQSTLSSISTHPRVNTVTGRATVLMSTSTINILYCKGRKQIVYEQSLHGNSLNILRRHVPWTNINIFHHLNRGLRCFVVHLTGCDYY